MSRYNDEIHAAKEPDAKSAWSLVWGMPHQNWIIEVQRKFQNLRKLWNSQSRLLMTSKRHYLLRFLALIWIPSIELRGTWKKSTTKFLQQKIAAIQCGSLLLSSFANYVCRFWKHPQKITKDVNKTKMYQENENRRQMRQGCLLPWKGKKMLENCCRRSWAKEQERQHCENLS